MSKTWNATGPLITTRNYVTLILNMSVYLSLVLPNVVTLILNMSVYLSPASPNDVSSI